MNMESVLSKIQKLLNFAKDERGNEHECANAAGQARKLMDKYNIDMSSVILAELGSGEGIVKEGIAEANYDVKIPTWYNELATVCAKSLDCQATIGTAKHEGKWKVSFFVHGYKSDVQVCQWLFSYIHDQVISLCTTAWKHKLKVEEDYGIEKGVINASERRRWKNAYCKGMVRGIASEITAVYKKQEEVVAAEVVMSNSNALVVVREAKEKAIIEKFGEFKYSKPGRKQDGAASRLGYRDSSKINVNRVVEDQTEPLRLK
jgi:hypothetical protein